MKRKMLFVLLSGALLVVATAADAIVWGEKDGQTHPYVGLIVFDINGVPNHRCSGTLLSPTVFLTAGHCTAGATAARVWFDTDLSNNPEYPFGGSTSTEGSPFTHPSFNNFAGFPNTSDVGVVILDSPVSMATYGQLPSIGAVDALDQPGKPPRLPIVGYGLQAVVPSLMADRIRYQAEPKLIEINSANTGGFNLHLSSNPGKGGGTGGACFGDSGGPAFLQSGSNVVVGVGSFVLNQNCVGAGFYYRVDTQHAQGFINSFLPAAPPLKPEHQLTTQWARIKTR
jgi:hypothetical protein